MRWMSDTRELLGIRFAHCGIEQALEWISKAATRDSFSYVVTPNVDHVVMYWKDGNEPWRLAYRKAVANCDLCLNDSRVLQRLARLSGVRLPAVPGSDVVQRLVEDLGGICGSIALIGGTPREAGWIASAMPRHEVHHMEPPMGVRDSAGAQIEIAKFVEEARADIVLLAIGAPQSEMVALTIASRGRARGVALCIGASVEFLSGHKRRAPAWMQRAGLEWLFRLVSEPGRLWRRYLVEGPRIFAIWWRHRGTR